MANIGLLYDDVALGRPIMPPHAACVRLAQVRWDPRVPLSLENCVVGEMKDVSCAISRAFSMPDEGALYEELGVTHRMTMSMRLESRSIPLSSVMGSLSGVPRRCGASMLLLSSSFGSGRCSSMLQLHFSMSTKP
ncbi:hypothetical protein BGW80DRAFT_445711 [Lactifluus volemus]|nr:hypothetical protein BGW80DRAFT_445711 [Lactifluus volemus]